MSMEEGAILEGKVVNITNFGAFIELEGKTGLVHISEVADSYVKDIHDFLTEGETIKVKVLKIEDNGKISLSTKQANPDLKAKPGSSAAQEDHRPTRPAAPDRPSAPRSYRPMDDEGFRPKPLERGPQSFEDMMSRFQKDSEEKVSEFKRRSELGGNTKKRR